MSSEQYNSAFTGAQIDEAIDKVQNQAPILAGTAQALTDAKKAQARENIGAASAADLTALNNEKVDKTDLETEVADQLDGVKVDIVQEVLAQLNGEAGSVFGKVNDDGTITITTDLAEGDYTLMYENDDGSLTEVGTITVGAVAVYYTIARTLENCVSTKADTTIEEGSAWTETITANDGYELSNVVVTMGGVNVTSSVYANGAITIPAVTGDVVITATATAVVLPSYTNRAIPTDANWKNNTRINSSGVETAANGIVTTNYIAATMGDVIRVKGLNLLDDATTYERVLAYKSDNTYLGQVNPTTYPTAFTTDANGVTKYTLFFADASTQISGVTWVGDVGKIRLCGTLTGTANDVIITVNEDIAGSDGDNTDPDDGNTETPSVGYTNLFDVNGAGYEAWNGSKMHTNWMPYKYTDNDGNGTIYHIKGWVKSDSPYKFQFGNPSYTAGSLIYCANANVKAMVTAEYDNNVKILQHSTSETWVWVRFEFREDIAANLIITANENIVDA